MPDPINTRRGGHRRDGISCALTIILCLASASRTAAETLADALALAYETNPTLQAQRAQQRSLDETYVQARAGWRPTASASGLTSWSRTDLGGEVAAGALVSNGQGGFTQLSGTSSYELNQGSGTLTASQPIYTGGRTAAAVRAAEAVVLAGREGLRATEAQVLQSVVTVYEDVRRDAQILNIRDHNAGVLRSQLEETRAKFDVGQLTRTDVAQAEAQLASAQALLATAKAQLQISRANYAAVVGRNPDNLAAEPELPGLPTGVDQAFDVADASNPTLRQAQITEQASRARVAEAKAANRPTVSAQASLGYSGVLSPFAAHNFDRTVAGELVFNQPIFTGGVNASLIRQALEQNTSDRVSIESARRAVVQAVAQAWNTMIGDRASVTANEQQVRAAEVAFEGIKEQYRVGLSTTLDVLIQQQTLETAQLSLVQARHDEYVATGALLSAMGRLEARDLVRGVAIYDPVKSFDRVKASGAPPWEPLIAAIDSVGAPDVGEPAPMAPEPVPSGLVTMVPVPSGGGPDTRPLDPRPGDLAGRPAGPA